jgi:hypothetical protein
VGFDSAAIVDPLDCRLVDPKGAEIFKGTITEPSTKQVQEFQKAWRDEILRFKDEAGIDEGMTREEFMAALEKTDPTQLGETMANQAKMHADLSSGHPSAAMILRMGHRQQIGFHRWLQKEVLNPEVLTGDGKRPAGTEPSSSAGGSGS